MEKTCSAQLKKSLILRNLTKLGEMLISRISVHSCPYKLYRGNPITANTQQRYLQLPPLLSRVIIQRIQPYSFIASMNLLDATDDTTASKANTSPPTIVQHVHNPVYASSLNSGSQSAHTSKINYSLQILIHQLQNWVELQWSQQVAC